MASIPANIQELPNEVVVEEDRGLVGSSLRNLWAAAYRNRYIFLISLGLCVLLGILYLLFATPIFQADASVQIEEQSARVLKQNDLEPAINPMDTERFLQTQLDIIRSRSVALAVAREQRLFGNKAFLQAMNINDKLDVTGKVTARQADQERVLRILADNMDVELPIDSRVATISFTSPDPQVAAKIANSFADSFIKSNLLRKYDTSAYAREFLGTRLGEAQQRLEASERQALDYASRAGLIDASNGAVSRDGTQGPKSLTVQRLVTLNTAYADAVARRIQVEQKWQQARGGQVMALPEVLENPAIQDLLQRRAGLRADYEDQRQTRKDDFPSVRKAKAQIEELDRQVATLAGNIRGSLRSQFDVARAQEGSLKDQIGSLESATLDEQNRNVQLSILRRATDTNRSAYDSLLQRFRELSAEAGIQPNNIQLVDRADVPMKPVSPNLVLTLLLSIFVGLLAGIAAVFVKEHLNDTVRSAQDVATRLDLPMLGAVPVVKQGAVDEELLDQKSVISEAFNSVRASLMLASQNGLPTSILMTSVQPGEGKTTTTFALSTGLARIGKRVVVIDCDLRRPTLHKRFGRDNRVGVSDYLTGQAQLSAVIQPSGFEGLTLISCGRIPPNPTELLSGTRFQQFVDELRASFDVVVVDGPPVLGLADAVMLGSKVEATVLVMESGRNYRGAMLGSVSRLRKGGSRIVGVVLTKQNIRNLGYGYDYAYQYSYGSTKAAA